MRFLVVLLICGMCLSSVDAKSSKKRIELNDVVETRLKSVLEASESLSSVMYAKKDPLVKTQIESLKAQVRIAQQTPKTGSEAQHINRILQTIEKDLNKAEASRGVQQTKSLQSAFRQIVMLYQSYKIEASYRIFYCKKDRSVWLQKDKKPQNPFEQSSECARMIN